MTKMDRSETAEWLQEHDNFCILTHRKPDGDTAGSAAALCRGLRQLGKQAAILENPELSSRYASLHEGLTVSFPQENDTLISVDVAAAHMLPDTFAHLTDRIELRIDHHASSSSFTPLELVDPAAAATAEIVYDLLMELWVDLDQQMAQALYVGTSTDTGCFRYSNTTDHSFLVAAACAASGAPVYQLNQELFETNSLARLRLQGWMVEHAKFLRDGKVVICAIPRSVERELGLTEDDLDNISSFPRTIAGVCLAATIREHSENESKASLRSVPGWDSAAICAVFGGGGHAGASGARIRLPLDQAVQALEEAILAATEDK